MDYLGRFLQQAGATPTALAVADDCEGLSYERLAGRSGSLSAYLHRLGLPPGRAVAVLVPRTTDILSCALASMRAGGIYMPMDSAYPSDRLKYMLEDSSAWVVLTTRSLWDAKQIDTAVPVVFIDEFQEDEAIFDAAHSPDDYSYLLYTSGTTGRPKGVIHSHRSLLAMSLQWEDARFDSTGVVAGYTFIASVFMMFPPLIVGGRCHIVPDWAKSDMASLQAYVEEHDIHQLFLPASLAASMAEEYPLDGVTIFSAGEKLRNFRRRGGCNVINAYGSTEGVVVLATAASGDEIDIPLGAPCKGIAVRIVNDSFEDVAEGEIGELVYSGDIMAECYLGLEEQTAAKWTVADGRRWYRTGDRVKLDADGFYHYVGRADNMVKIRGFRVEIGEVENCIRSLAPSIEDVVVVLRTLHGIDHLCCYYTSQDSGLDMEQLKSSVKERLAEYMIPDIWVALDSFPRNPNGKIMRNSLPEPQQHLEALSMLFSEVEMRVEEAARTVLGSEMPVDIDESFLDMGGDSIRAMKLSALLSEQGIRITGSQILRLKVLRTIAAEATVAYERLWSPEQYSQVKYRFSQWGETILKVLPLTSGQDDMLFNNLIYPDSGENRSIYVLDTESAVSEEELTAAVEASSRDNEGLRAAVIYHGVSVFQQVITDRHIPCQCVDLRATKDPWAEIANICERMKRSPLDLEQSPAMEVVYARTKDHEGLLLIKVLHVSLGMAGVRKAIYGIIEALLSYHPEDRPLKGWSEILSCAVEEEDITVDGPSKTAGLLGNLSKKDDEIAVYSHCPGKKNIVFVHTGNTGSDAYYQLADKIGEYCSFSVIEPFNLYHPSEAIDGGISAIATKYIEILRRHQPEGPYFLGGWCYGGVVAHEMACQLKAAGEIVEHLVMLDSHAVVDPVSRELFKSMSSFNKREYFETSPLFADLRAQGLLESMVINSKRVARDLALHEPSIYDGPVTYFKPKVTPSGISGDALRYWQEMMEHKAGGYERFCTNLKVISTPHEHDLMMDEESLSIIVPELLKLLDEAD